MSNLDGFRAVLHAFVMLFQAKRGLGPLDVGPSEGRICRNGFAQRVKSGQVGAGVELSSALVEEGLRTSHGLFGIVRFWSFLLMGFRWLSAIRNRVWFLAFLFRILFALVERNRLHQRSFFSARGPESNHNHNSE